MDIQDQAQPVFSEPVAMPVLGPESPMGQALVQTGNALQQVGLSFYKAQQAAAIFKGRTQLFSDLRDARAEAMQEPDPDKSNALYQKRAADAQAKASQLGFDDYTRSRIDLYYNHYNSMNGFDVAQNNHAKVINSAQADLTQSLTQIQQEAAADTPENLAAHKAEAKQLFDDAMPGGILHPLQRQQMETDLYRDMDHAAAKSLVYGDAPGAIKKIDDPNGLFPNLKPSDRVQLKEDAVNHSVSMMKLQDSQDARAEREAAKALTKQQNDLASDFYAHMAQHDDPGIEQHILANRTNLGPAKFDEIMKSLKGGAFGDDHDTFIKLQGEVHDENTPVSKVKSDALVAAKGGLITDATLASVLSKADEGATARQGKIKTPIDIGRELTLGYTQVDNTAMFASMDSTRRQRGIEAVAAYDTWAQNNKGASTKAATDFARYNAQEWIHGIRSDSMSSLPRPGLVSWVRNDKGIPDWQAMGKALAPYRTTQPARFAQDVQALGKLKLTWEKNEMLEQGLTTNGPK